MIGARQTEVNDVENYAYVAARQLSKGDSAPTDLTAEVLALYGKYLSRLKDPSGPAAHTGFTAEQHNKLEANVYYLKLKQFASLKSFILKSVRWGKCAYCYQLGANEVDHYLPKSKFGEYSVYSPNLVPICRTCNGKKLSKFTANGSARPFVHPYFDKLPTENEVFLVATIQLAGSVLISFSLDRPPGILDDVWLSLKNQFMELDLRVRYMEEAVEMMTGMLGPIQDSYDKGGAAEVGRALHVAQRSKTRNYGENHWSSAALMAMAESREFCNGGFKLLDLSWPRV